MISGDRVKAHHTVAHHKALKVNGGCSVEVVSINHNSQVRDVLSRIRLTSDEEGTLLVFRELLEEIKHSIQVIDGSVGVTVVIAFIGVIGVSHACRGLDEEQVRLVVPGVFVEG